MTSANWGLWHHEIHLEDELLQLPFLPDTLKSTAETIIAIVDKLRNYCPPQQGGFYPEASPMEVIREQRHHWEGDLDEAVFKSKKTLFLIAAKSHYLSFIEVQIA
jgi:hypothetical protein